MSSERQARGHVRWSTLRCDETKQQKLCIMATTLAHPGMLHMPPWMQRLQFKRYRQDRQSDQASDALSPISLAGCWDKSAP
ncbi:hypothetical protein WL88_23715 [Burkholderia diffusa]|uniref:Uncharacterized protein n=1 Tax=Burkholderia diffusa TaxID=488732 RepID=A0AAW3PAQ9_9BURK|nr:hypothetical protein WT50_29940 [Burkholderia territorii]KWF30177.1 hypothetical protein WL85_24340 [Burkholderia diffusa]KWE33611.1 hypothetical protein WT49_17535 [Burkholderia territorii]KWE38855.1 hypothetical protein WT51_30300 [Burkholderia territorii]KWF39055.1 hypothetical protein WL86_17135 [Burkholderia diffusa]